MADDKKAPDGPVEAPKAEAPQPEQQPRPVTENPGEGSYMFSDWAMF